MPVFDALRQLRIAMGALGPGLHWDTSTNAIDGSPRLFNHTWLPKLLQRRDLPPSALRVPAGVAARQGRKQLKSRRSDDRMSMLLLVADWNRAAVTHLIEKLRRRIVK
jgi:hypothetical protein